MAKFKTVTEIATCTKPSWTNRQKAMFHAYNPNGMATEYINLCAKIAEMVGDSQLPYCCKATEYEMMLYKMCGEKAVKRDDLWLAMWGLDRRIQEAKKFIEDAQVTA